jgi:transposase InsO family protein
MLSFTAAWPVRMALIERQQLHHSDRGVQYASLDYTEMLKRCFHLLSAEMGDQSSNRIHQTAVPGAGQLPNGIGEAASGGHFL